MLAHDLNNQTGKVLFQIKINHIKQMHLTCIVPELIISMPWIALKKCQRAGNKGVYKYIQSKCMVTFFLKPQTISCHLLDSDIFQYNL